MNIIYHNLIFIFSDIPDGEHPWRFRVLGVSPAAGGSVYDQFIANGGTDALWQNIVMPESGGNPNAVSPNGYMGLGQTKEGWGTGDVATQTNGLVNYAVSRYGSVDGAVQFRAANGWW